MTFAIHSWKIFEALENNARVPGGGYSGLLDVNAKDASDRWAWVWVWGRAHVGLRRPPCVFGSGRQSGFQFQRT
jgi:hypothetical protein